MKRALLGAVLLFSTVLTVEAVVPMAGTQTPTAAPPTDSRGGTTAPAAGSGRGGGFRNPAAALYTENCAGCHGAELAGGRAPSLFDSEWLHGSDDESVAKNIHEGFPAAGMIAFKGVLSDEQIWQLVAYIRTQAANLKGKPVYVPDPANQIIKSEKQTFKIEVVTEGLETPWGIAFLPDGRLLVTERPGRLRIIENGKLLPEGVKGLPKVWEKQDGGMFDVEVHPQYVQQRLDLPLVLGSAAGLHAAGAPPADASAPAAAASPAQGGGGRGGRGGPPDPPSMTVIVRGKINKDNEWIDQQVLFRAPPEVYSSSNAHYGSRFIFDKRASLLHARREAADDGRAGSLEADRQDPPGERRRIDAEGQPVRRALRRGPDRSGATGTAIRRGSPGIPSAASCGNRSTDRRAVTRSTSSSRRTTTGGA